MFVVTAVKGRKRPLSSSLFVWQTRSNGWEIFPVCGSLHSHILLLFQLGFDGIQPWEHYVPSTSPGCFPLGHSFPMAVVKACW